MIDIESSKLDDKTLTKYIINAYVERDERIYSENGINTLIFAWEKVKAFKLDYKNKDIETFIKEKNYFLFYSLFSIQDLCVLGY